MWEVYVDFVTVTDLDVVSERMGVSELAGMA